MEFKINAGTLNKDLNNLSKIIPSKSLEPLVENMLLEIKGNDLFLKGTDLNNSIFIKETINEQGNTALVVPFKLFKDIVLKLKQNEDLFVKIEENVGENIPFEEKDQYISLIQGKAIFKIKTLSSVDFPILPEIKEGINLEIQGKNLRDSLKKVLPAVEKDEKKKPEFQGVYLEKKEENLRFVSTDGKRLAYSQIPLKNIQEFKPVLIPWKVMDTIFKTIQDEDVKITLTGYEAIFNIKNLTIISLLIGIPFPKYETIIPPNFEYNMSLNKNEFLSSLDKINTLVYNRTDIINLKFKDGVLKIEGSRPEEGDEGFDELNYEGNFKTLEIKFDGTRLIEMIEGIATDKVELYFNSSAHPAVLKEKDSLNYFCLILPYKSVD